MRHVILAVCLFIASCTGLQNKQDTVESVPPKESVPDVPTSSTLQGIQDMAASSKCASYNWKDRGLAPKAYMRGMALAYARAVCHIQDPEVAVVAQARTFNDAKDALSWYNSNFQSLDMDNSKPGQDTLRHAYTLLIGLGMRESSGEHCCGRDMSADFSTADSAEAGLFQASWGAKRAHPVLPGLLEQYMDANRNCFYDVFSKGVSCTANDAKNWGTGQGAVFQMVSKSCPAFAVSYAAVLIRTTGGTSGEFGPLRKKAAEIRPECNSMLKQVDAVLKEKPELCKEL